jgi:hypothetical protein
MNIENFDPNPILININKLGLHKFMEDQTFQPNLAQWFPTRRTSWNKLL